MSIRPEFVESLLHGILKSMFIVERFFFILIGIALIAAAGLGFAIYYHFSKFSPDQSVTTTTVSIYGIGVGAIALFTFVIMILRS